MAIGRIVLIKTNIGSGCTVVNIYTEKHERYEDYYYRSRIRRS